MLRIDQQPADHIVAAEGSSAANRRRVALHEYAGYAFAFDLATELQARDYDVDFIYCASNLAPRGVEARSAVRSTPLRLRKPFDKYSPLTRAVQEVELGLRVIGHLRATKPEVLISSDVPVLTALVSTLWARAHRIDTVFWVQDLQAGLARSVLGEGRAKRAMAKLLERLETATAKLSHSVIVISEPFQTHLVERGVSGDKVSVLPNWGPLRRIPVLPKANSWASAHGLVDSFNYVYSGTLAKKHNPELLLALARAVPHDGSVRVVVVAEGAGADWLVLAAREQDLHEVLQVHPFQPFSDVPAVMASADVLVALLEPGAGSFSVPSKVLSYLCANRPILGAIPAENQAAALIVGAGAGLAVDPSDEDGFVRAALHLLDTSAATAMGAAARQHAEDAFEIGSVADRFIVASRLGRRPL